MTETFTLLPAIVEGAGMKVLAVTTVLPEDIPGSGPGGHFGPTSEVLSAPWLTLGWAAATLGRVRLCWKELCWEELSWEDLSWEKLS